MTELLSNISFTKKWITVLPHFQKLKPQTQTSPREGCHPHFPADRPLARARQCSLWSVTAPVAEQAATWFTLAAHGNPSAPGQVEGSLQSRPCSWAAQATRPNKLRRAAQGFVRPMKIMG